MFRRSAIKHKGGTKSAPCSIGRNTVNSVGQNRNRLASEGNGKSYATRINEKKRRLSELRRHTRQMSADVNVQDNRCASELQGQYVTNLEDKEILLNKHRERLNSSDRSSDKPLWLPQSANVANFARSISELNDSSSLSDQFDFLQKFSPKLKAEGYRPFDGSKITQPRAVDHDAAPFCHDKDTSEIKTKQSGKNRDFQFAGVDRGSLEHIPEDRALEPQPRKKLGAIGKMNSDASLGSYSSVFSDGTLSSDTQNTSDLTSIDSDFSDDSFTRNNSLPKDLRLQTTKMAAAVSITSRDIDSLKSDSSALTFTGNSLTEKNEQDELTETPTHKEMIEDTDCFTDETPKPPLHSTNIQPVSTYETEAPTIIRSGLYRPADGNRNHKTKSVHENNENQTTDSSVRVTKISCIDSMALVDMPIQSQARQTRKPKKLSRTLTSGIRAASQPLLPQKRRYTVETVVVYLKMAKQDQDEADSVQFVYKCGEPGAKLSARSSFPGLEFKGSSSDVSSFPRKSPSDTEQDRKNLSKSGRETKLASTDDANRSEKPVLNSAKLKCADGRKESSLLNYEDKQNECNPSQAGRSKPRASSSSSSASSHFKAMGQSFSDPGLCDSVQKEDNTKHFTSGPEISRENLQIVALNIAATRQASKLRKPLPENRRVYPAVTKASHKKEAEQKLRVAPVSSSLPSIVPEFNQVYAYGRPKLVETKPSVGLQTNYPPKIHMDSSDITQVHTTSHKDSSDITQVHTTSHDVFSTTESAAGDHSHSSLAQKAPMTGSMQEHPKELHGTSVPHVGVFRKALGTSSKTKEIKTVCASVNVSNIRSSFENKPHNSTS